MLDTEDKEPPAEFLSAYLAHFTESVDHFRTHLSGSNGDDPPPASYLVPRAYWTVSEKNAFFRGLVIHSRLRPDLIAEEVKTKTVPDVCAYLKILELAEQDLAKGTINTHDSASLPYQSRDEHPAALEVSEEWIALEERMADAMNARRPTWEQEDFAQERQAEAESRKAIIRVPWGGGRTVSAERDREGEKTRRQDFERWLAQKKLDWKREDALSVLDYVDLTALDKWLRDEEEGGGMVALPDEDYGKEQEPVPEFQCTKEPGLLAVGELAVGLSDELIDPALLAISRPSTFLASEISAVQPRMPVHPSLDNSTPPALPVSLNALHTTPSAPSVGTDENSLGDPSQMSPRSRRRCQKRLYMRRKRAQATGATLVEAAERQKPGRKSKTALSSARSTDVLRSQASSTSIFPRQSLLKGARSNVPSVVTAKAHSSERKTQPNKRQLSFISSGVNLEWLRKEGLDLFHLQAVSNMMGTYNQVYDIPETIASSISGETLRLLRNLVVHFVAEVMSCAILCREQETVAKLQTKVWRLKEHQMLSASDIKQALVFHSTKVLDKRTHFARLLGQFDFDSDQEGDTEHDKDIDAAEEGSHFPKPDGSLLEPLSLHRTIFPPFMNPPSSWSRSVDPSVAIDSSVYMPLPPSNLLFTDIEFSADDSLLPYMDDDKLLNEELLEEEQLSKSDALRDYEVEQALWAMMKMENPNAGPKELLVDVADEPVPIRGRTRQKRKRDEVPSVDERTDTGVSQEKMLADATALDVDEPVPKRARRKKGTKSRLSQRNLKTMQPGIDSRIKSSVYVFDSD